MGFIKPSNDVGIYGYDESCETCKIGAFDENE